MQLLLDLPETAPELAKVVETNPKRLKEWLIGLPTSDIVECGRSIFDALASLNRIELGVDERVRLLNEYETMLDMLAGSFETIYVSTGLPMRDRARQAGLLCRNLWLEMAMGWKISLVNRMEKRGLFSSGKVEPLFVQRILYCYWRFFRVNCRLFMPMPKDLWSEAHQLFRLGAKNNFLDEPTAPKNRSIATLYKRLLLLSLADPLRFAPQEQDKVADIVENYGHLAHFQPAAKFANTAGYFLVELDSDKAPYFVGNRTSEPPSPASVLLETSELSRHLHKTEAAIEAKAPQSHDRARLLARLQILRRTIRQWSIAPQRTYQRIPSHAMVDIAFGLLSVANQINHSAMQAPLPRFPEDEKQIGHGAEPDLSRWQVFNESPAGYAVRAISINDEEACAGEIVALRTFPEAPWIVATVRWLQQSEENGIEMGLQVLSSRAVAVLVSPSIGAGELHYLPALLLPEIPVLKLPARIAASKGTYTPLRELSLLSPEGEYKVRATKLVEQQMGYDLFDFDPC